MSKCQQIHLTARGETVRDVVAALLALIIIPAIGYAAIVMLLP